MEKLYPVTGIIHGMAGRGANFTILTIDGELVDSPVHIDPGGTFRLRLPSGSYRLKVHSAMEREQQLVGTGMSRSVRLRYKGYRSLSAHKSCCLSKWNTRPWQRPAKMRPAPSPHT